MQPDRSSARPSLAPLRSTLAASIFLCTLALSLGACAQPTATPEPPPPTALPDPPTVEPPTATAVVTPTATLTPTATAAPTLPPPPVVPTTAAVVLPTTAAPVVAPTTAPTTAPPTANSGLPVIEFYPDNGQANLPKDQLCTAVNWRTENVTDVRLQVGGGPATSVAASGRQGDICFGEDKLKVRLIYKHKDGREESREIDLTREDD